jgi:RimJ/RimL family protein N-acetyltransferase
MKDLELIIRPAETEDAQYICTLLDAVGAENIYLTTVPGESTVNRIEALIEQQSTNRCLLLVGDSHGEIVGVLGFIGGVFKKTAHVVEIGMAIKRDSRNAGLGSTLLREGISWARKKGFYRLELGVLSTNEKAVSLYKKFGFQEEGVRKNRYHIDGAWVDEVLMAKLL